MLTTKRTIIVLTASTRPNGLGPAIAEWALKTLEPFASTLGVRLQPVSLATLDLPFLDEEEQPATGIYRHQHTKEWSATVDAADGFIVVTPEYNYGMPASLKNALDYLSREWAWKPMGFISYGNTSAGTRSVQHTKQVITTLRIVPLGATIALRLRDAINDGHVRDDENLTRSAEDLLSELVRVANALKPLREAERATSLAGPVPGSYLRRLGPDDAAQVIVLQRSCWVDEAVANSTLSLVPLHEDFVAVQDWLSVWTVDGLWLDGRLIGMVRTQVQGTIGHIGRLAVVPDQRGTGLGGWLLRHAEESLSDECDVLELSTGAESRANIRLYERHGFVFAHSDDPAVITLRKRSTIERATAV